MKAPGALKSVMQESQNGCKRNSLCADEGKQLNGARTKQQEEKNDTGMRPVGRENKGIRRELRQKKYAEKLSHSSP